MTVAYNHKRVRRAAREARIAYNDYGVMKYPRPRRTILAHSVRLACANWAQADRVSAEWWARALEAR